MSPRLPTPLLAYRLATAAIAPLAAPAWLRWRAGQGKEDPDRIGERYGKASRERPPGEVVWAHGASIGETLSVLPVVDALVRRGLKIVVTSGTLTSAEILARRLPPGARHQFLPLDAPTFVRRFLDHWQPRLALFAESELWPNLILELDRHSIPLVLVNARMSARSFARWERAPTIGRALLGRAALCIAQSEADAERLARLGAPLAEVSGNLKFDLPPPPADPAVVEELAALIAGRPVWMAASTHPGEDELVYQAHRTASARTPGLLTILAPRHPLRGKAVAEAALHAGLGVARRSQGRQPQEADDVYLVDTAGEFGLFFRLAPLVFMGGSLVPHGGQNPFEPARLGAAILHGPHVGNFTEIYAALDGCGGAVQVEDGAALADKAAGLIADPRLTRAMGRGAAEASNSLGGALERTLRAIEPFLPPAGEPGQAVW